MITHATKAYDLYRFPFGNSYYIVCVQTEEDPECGTSRAFYITDQDHTIIMLCDRIELGAYDLNTEDDLISHNILGWINRYERRDDNY